MGQFKPMVKMMTTEPTVELKLKKGGAVKKADGGMMAMPSAMSSMPARGGMMPVARPKRPSMAARRAAMAGATMKDGGESKATHKAEMSKMKGLEKELKSHESKPASKGHKGLKSGGMATGGVTNGQGGYAKGGIINTEGQGGKYRNTKMDTAKPDHSPAKTGGVKEGNGGGYKTGGVAKANAGGYKKGGAPKKAYAAGGTVDSGKPVAMPQGRKKPSSPVSINQLSGTFKKGGSVTPAEGRLQKNFAAENKTAMKQAKAQSNEVYSKYQKMKGGGATSDKEMDMSKGAYDAHYANEKAENEAMRESILGLPKKMMQGVKGLFGPKTSEGSVTKTEKSVTVSPAGKKRGGSAC